MGEELWGVRLDTAENIIDKSIVPIQDKMENPYGVVPELVAMVRDALDREGFTHVKIVVSGGFDSERIAKFERSGSPVDAYGVGSSLMRGEYDFTADVVLLDGKPCAKVGREYEPNTRLLAVKKEEYRKRALVDATSPSRLFRVQALARPSFLAKKTPKGGL